MEQQKRTNVRLTMQEDFELTKWLHAHDMQPGETIADLLKLIRIDLKSSRINYNHVQARLQAFQIELVPAPERDQLKRIEALERALRDVAYSHAELLGHFGAEVPDEVTEICSRYASK